MHLILFVLHIATAMPDNSQHFSQYEALSRKLIAAINHKENRNMY